MRLTERASRCVVVVGWMALLTFWSSQGNLPIDQPSIAVPLHGLQHRVAHLVAFALLGLLGRWAFDGLPRAAWLAVILASAFGASDEWHQSFTPGRRPAVDDWLLDTAAATLAVYVWPRLTATRLALPVQRLAPVAVAAVFAVGVGLAVRPGLPIGPALNRAAVREVSSQMAHTALEFARSTRNAARQVRSALG